MDSQITIVALRYLEPDYKETEKCIAATDLPVVWAFRGGVGNFSKAMNDAFKKVETPYVWFITDIKFEPHVPHRLRDNLVVNNLVAIHPQHASDHHTHQPGHPWSVGVQEVPYIEWTAPLVKSAWFHLLGGLDENHHYWYQDLLFSKAVREHNGTMGVDHTNPIEHIYRRKCVRHEVTRRRYNMRRNRDRIERQLLADRFGPDWRDILWCRGKYEHV